MNYRTVLMSLLATLSLSTASSQTDVVSPKTWFGVSGTSHLLFTVVQARIGAHDLLAEGLDARLELSYLVHAFVVCPAVPDADCAPPLAFEVATAALWRFAGRAEQGPGVYLGAAPRLALFFYQNPSLLLGISGFVGADYQFGDTSLALEAGGTIFYERVGGPFFLPHLSLGVNFYF